MQTVYSASVVAVTVVEVSHDTVGFSLFIPMAAENKVNTILAQTNFF